MIFLPKWDQATSHFALYTLPLNKINAPYPIGIFSVFNQSIDKISTFFDVGKKPSRFIPFSYYGDTYSDHDKLKKLNNISRKLT